MGHALVAGDTASSPQLGEAVATGRPSHSQVVGHGHEQRPGVEVARLRAGVDFEYRPARMGEVDRVAVVDDAFKDAQGAYAHHGMVPGWSL